MCACRGPTGSARTSATTSWPPSVSSRAAGRRAEPVRLRLQLVGVRQCGALPDDRGRPSPPAQPLRRHQAGGRAAVRVVRGQLGRADGRRCATSRCSARASGRTWRCTGSWRRRSPEPRPPVRRREQVRELTHVTDAIVAARLGGRPRRSKPGTVFNISGGVADGAARPDRARRGRGRGSDRRRGPRRPSPATCSATAARSCGPASSSGGDRRSACRTASAARWPGTATVAADPQRRSRRSLIHSRVERSSLMLFSCRRTRSDRLSTPCRTVAMSAALRSAPRLAASSSGAHVDGRRHVAEVADLRVQALEAGLHPEAVLLDLGADVVAAGGPVDGLLGQLDGVVDRRHQPVQQRQRLGAALLQLHEDRRRQPLLHPADAGHDLVERHLELVAQQIHLLVHL